MESVYARFVFKMFATLVFAASAVCGSVHAQGSMNVVLRGNWDNNALPTVSGYQYNDVWGYAAGGREYAFVGSTVGIHVIDVTNPTAMVHIAQLNSGCVSTIWHDFATYQNYLYVISDNCAGSTLQVWDLGSLPAAPTLVYNSNAHFSTAHTLFINEQSGRIYVSGANTQMNGILILDILGHPTTPTLAASFFLGAYTHDTYVHNDTLYAFFGTNGVGSFDLTNLTNPYAMGYTYAYPEAGYAHSGWGAKNNKTLIWIDETQDKGIHVGSVEDPYDISWTNNFRSTLLAPAHTNSIAHNVIVVGDYAYISYYQDGLQIWNISNPTIPVRAGYYDTNINATYTGMFGAWGIHRPLPSGNILVSDTQNGLFVLQFNSVFPAEMVNFEADALQDRVHLRWSTESEVSCRSFMVQRSQDGKTFEDVVEVAAAGNSTQLLNYDSYDEAPLPGRSFYRLRQNDFDGNTSFGEVREVDLGKGTFNMTAYPNPSNAGDRVSIRIEALQAASAEMEVTDLMGRTLLHQDIALQPGVAELDLPSADWASGSYLLRLTAEGVRLEQKLLITR